MTLKIWKGRIYESLCMRNILFPLFKKVYAIFSFFFWLSELELWFFVKRSLFHHFYYYDLYFNLAKLCTAIIFDFGQIFLVNSVSSCHLRKFAPKFSRSFSMHNSLPKKVSASKLCFIDLNYTFIKLLKSGSKVIIWRKLRSFTG